MLAYYKENKFWTRDAIPYISNDQRYKCIIKGRIYNARKLLAKLQKAGVYLKTKTDSEIIIELYRFSGSLAWNELRGEFSIILYDQETHKLIAVRDGFGIMPLYYKLVAGGVYISSKLSKLEALNHLTEDKLDYDGLAHYFTFQYIPEEGTYLKDVKHLPAGCILAYVDQKVKITPYQTLKVIEGNKESTLTPEMVRTTIMESIYTRLYGLEEVGVFLSGGIDSTIIAYVTKKFNASLKAFTIGYKERKYSELIDAKKSAKAMGIEIISHVVNASQYWKATNETIRYLESPVADPSAPVLYLLAELASKKVDTVVSGEGADELFGGYPIYKDVDSLKLFNYIPPSIKLKLLSMSPKIPNIKGKGYLMRGCTPLANRYIGNAFIFTEEEKRELLKFNASSWHIITDPIYEQITDLAPLEQMQTIDLLTWTKGDTIFKNNRLTQAHGLEVIMPFLDESILKIAIDLTKTEKINGKISKSLLREAFYNELPKHIKKKKKRGFPVPLAKWLRTELYSDVRAVLQCSYARVIINQELALNMLEDHQLGRRDLSRPLWTIVIFILWTKQKMLFCDNRLKSQSNVG